jgi:hypothetical protein
MLPTKASSTLSASCLNLLLHVLLIGSWSYFTTEDQSASLSWWRAPIWGSCPDFYYCLTFAGFFVWGALPDWRMECKLLAQFLLGLASAVTLGSSSRRTHGHTVLSHLRLPPPGGPGPRIYIPPEEGSPIKHLGTKLPSRRLLGSLGYTTSSLTCNHTRPRRLTLRCYND